MPENSRTSSSDRIYTYMQAVAEALRNNHIVEPGAVYHDPWSTYWNTAPSRSIMPTFIGSGTNSIIEQEHTWGDFVSQSGVITYPSIREAIVSTNTPYAEHYIIAIPAHITFNAQNGILTGRTALTDLTESSRSVKQELNRRHTKSNTGLWCKFLHKFYKKYEHEEIPCSEFSYMNLCCGIYVEHIHGLFNIRRIRSTNIILYNARRSWHDPYVDRYVVMSMVAMHKQISYLARNLDVSVVIVLPAIPNDMPIIGYRYTRLLEERIIGGCTYVSIQPTDLDTPLH